MGFINASLSTHVKTPKPNCEQTNEQHTHTHINRDRQTDRPATNEEDEDDASRDEGARVDAGVLGLPLADSKSLFRLHNHSLSRRGRRLGGRRARPRQGVRRRYPSGEPIRRSRTAGGNSLGGRLLGLLCWRKKLAG